MSRYLPIPADEHSAMPYLSVKDAPAAIAFYTQVFEAREVGRLIMGSSIGHCELVVGDSKIMLAEENLEWGNKSPSTLGDTSVTIALYVPDVDVTFQRALAAGAVEVTPVKDEFYGLRVGCLCDPFGHKWHISTPIEVVSFAEMQRRCDAMML
jgi:PhnB protein